MIFFSHKCGQLGNRLFAFAHLIAFAHANGYKVANLAFEEYAPFFETTNQDAFCRFPTTRSLLRSSKIRFILFTINRVVLKALRILNITQSNLHSVVIADLPEYAFEEWRFYQLDTPAFKKLANKKFAFLFGRFFRDFENLQKHQIVIKEFFRPVPSIVSNVRSLMAVVRRDEALIIGVHIRRGDYREFKNGKYFFSQTQYFERMMSLQLQHPERRMRFLICSNEQIDRGVFADIDHEMGTGLLVEDLYSFAACDLLMGPPSTFTKWASFMGNVPLLQIEDINQPVTLQQFVFLTPETLYNF